MGIFFLNSANRIYGDSELNAVASLLFSTGVFNTQASTHALWKTSGDFFVSPVGASMNVKALPGMATARLTVTVGSGSEQQMVLFKIDSQLSASVAANPSLANRNDAVVLRIDQSVVDNDELNVNGSNVVSLVVVSGSRATALTDGEIAVALGGDPFVRLANILVPQSATEITESMITDARSLATMTRSLKMGSDVFRFYAVTEDPENKYQGDVWYNSADGILKFYDGVNTIALQSQDFNWGYYSPNGIDEDNSNFTPVEENEGESGVSSFEIFKGINNSDSTPIVFMAGQIFAMPDLDNPYFQIKMGNPTYATDMQFKVYTVTGGLPDTLVESLDTVPASEVPKNDYLGLILDGSLYTAGVEYMIIGLSSKNGIVNGDPEDYFTGSIQYSTYTDDDTFKGTGFKSDTLSTEDPLALDWTGTIVANRQFIMKISERTEIAVGETDATGNNHEVTQTFVAKSKDIIGFGVSKGADVGSPTGDLVASLYLADENFNAVGDVITSATITEADWAGSAGENKTFEIEYDELVIGQRYLIKIETDDNSDTDYYTLIFGSSVNGSAKYINNTDGEVLLNGDLFYRVLISGNSKIVVTDNDGKISRELLPRIYPKVTSIVSSDEPIFSVENTDAVSITALSEAITSMSANMIGVGQNFQRLVFRIKDDGTTRSITWGSNFANKGATAPTSTTANKLHTVTFEYDSIAEVWGCIDAKVEA